jgi:hypothetical protein
MEKKYSFWERLTSDTPSFFKRAQIFGASLAGLGTSLTQVYGIPSKVCIVLISIGSCIAVISQFAVQQYEPINTKSNNNYENK